MSSRTRLPDSESDSDFAWEEPFGTGTRRRGGGGGPSSRRPQRRVALPVVGVALCAGLFIGYLVGGSGGTSVVTETTTVTTAAQPSGPQAAAPAARATISVGVLNGADEAGLAGRTGERLRGMGYEDVTEGNSPSTISTTRVMYRSGAQAQALRVAEDLGAGAPVALTEGSEIAKAAPDSQVIAVLGRDAIGATPEGGAGATLNGDEADAGAAEASESAEAAAPSAEAEASDGADETAAASPDEQEPPATTMP